MIPLKSMTLQGPLFLSGTNLGTKLDAKKAGLQMFRASGYYVISFNGTGRFIESANVADAEPVSFADLGLDFEPGPQTSAPPLVVTQGSAPIRKNISQSAQVGDPTRGIK